jgi:hypothetical protein
LHPHGVFSLSLTLLLAACSPPPPGAAFVKLEPPRERVEDPGRPPAPGYAWLPGYHRFEEGRFVWVPGRWEKRPRPEAKWKPGRWASSLKGWFWIEGRWE